MIVEHFGLKANPFHSLPNTAGYYPATSQERALECVHRGLSRQESILLLTGETGLGKSLLCHCLLRRSTSSSAYLTNSHLSDRVALYQSILYDLGISHSEEREQPLRLLLTDHLLSTWAQSGATLLVVDEAHLLSDDLLEELRLLSNLESEHGRAIQILLVGQSVLESRLESPSLASLQQRLAVRASLSPMPLDESMDYLNHRIRFSGGKPEKVMEAEALELIAKAGRGVARVLNQLAYHSCEMACEIKAPVVDVEIVMETLTAHRIAVQSDPEAPWGSVIRIEESEAESQSKEKATPLPQKIVAPRPA